MLKAFLMNNMNSAFFLRKEDREPKWILIDAEGEVLGRLATKIADLLRGKGKPTYTSHTISGDHVVVINAAKVKLTGNKMTDKLYVRVSGYMGGKRETAARDVIKKHPTMLVEHAVEGMLPKNRLAKFIAKQLHVYADANHPHEGQLGL